MTAVTTGATAGELLRSIRLGEVSATDVVAAHLESLHGVHHDTNAIAAFEDDRAMADAARLDRAYLETGGVGPLHGLPVTVKDWIDVEGFPCAGDWDEHRDRRPQIDATVVARLRRAGAVVVAKTRPWGDVTHPSDPTRSVGGSSTGEAVVVATGASPLGIGSDSGGSVRLPAAWCGVFGFKPTAGLVPTTGHFPRVGARSDGRTQIGPLARSLDDLELALAVMAGPDGRDAGVAPVPLRSSSQADVRRLRFAVVIDKPGSELRPRPTVAAAVERAATALAAAGAARTQWAAPWYEEALDITRRYWRRRELSGAEVEQQLWDWDRFRRHYLEAAATVDLLLTPAAIGTAPVRREIAGDDFVYTLPASLTGSPAVVVPAGHDDGGLPTSVQLVGRPWEDHVVLAAGRVIADAVTDRA
jgi:amidase